MVNDGNFLLEYHQEVYKSDKKIGEELVQLNAAHLEDALDMPKEQRQVPVPAVRKIKKKHKGKK